jgi:uncharacterized membrane protein YoaK (UPF0700 family)
MEEKNTPFKQCWDISRNSNLGFIVGPGLAAILGSTIFGNTLPVMAALILCLVTLIVISLSLKEFKSSSGVVHYL